jgi:hypothetical protein
MDEKLSQSNPFPPIFLKVGLLLILFASSTSVIGSVRWIYYHVQNSLGLEIADVFVALLVILILGLIIVGFAVGFGAKRVLRQRKVQAHKIYQSLKWCKIFQVLWGYIGPPVEIEKKVFPEKQAIPEITLLLDRPPKRGRIPTYSMDRWIEVVAAWENRDTWRNPITLEEFLSQQFGTCADGSPQMSKKSFYDWKKKVHKEICEREAKKKNLSS